jgi:hypothetical protein
LQFESFGCVDLVGVRYPPERFVFEPPYQRPIRELHPTDTWGILVGFLDAEEAEAVGFGPQELLDFKLQLPCFYSWSSSTEESVLAGPGMCITDWETTWSARVQGRAH